MHDGRLHDGIIIRVLRMPDEKVMELHKRQGKRQGYLRQCVTYMLCLANILCPSIIPVWGLSDLSLVIQALREHCSLSGHDPSKAAKSSKQKQGLAPVQPAVPLELAVVPISDQVEMERYCDIHRSLCSRTCMA